MTVERRKTEHDDRSRERRARRRARRVKTRPAPSWSATHLPAKPDPDCLPRKGSRAEPTDRGARPGRSSSNFLLEMRPQPGEAPCARRRAATRHASHLPFAVVFSDPCSGRLEDRTLLATVTWASDVSGDWDNPSMWTGGAVPGPGDDAVIGFSDITVTHDTSASDTVDSVSCAASLDISSGSLSIDTTSPSQPSSTVSGQFNLNAPLAATLRQPQPHRRRHRRRVDNRCGGNCMNFQGSSFTFSESSSINAANVGFNETSVDEAGTYAAYTPTAHRRGGAFEFHRNGPERREFARHCAIQRRRLRQLQSRHAHHPDHR